MIIDKRTSRLRATIAHEAARLMYEEDVKQYFTAKRLAARRMLGRVGGRQLRYRPADLPSNGEIRDALLALAELAEGSKRGRRLFAMRVTALEAMRALGPFDPRLIGSVSTGHVRRGSDIDLHVFTDDEDALFAHLKSLRWACETERVSISKFGEIRDYLHVHVADVFAVELTVYARRELRLRPRSSTDGKPIDRLSPARLEALLAHEHTESWEKYLDEGVIDGLDQILEAEDDEAPRPGPFDGLLADGPGELLVGPEETDPWEEEYEAIPGFEDEPDDIDDLDDLDAGDDDDDAAEAEADEDDAETDDAEADEGEGEGEGEDDDEAEEDEWDGDEEGFARAARGEARRGRVG